MSKADTLLKRATFFERMALYSDRKSFLEALSQQQPLMEGEFQPNPHLRPLADPDWEAARAREFGTATTIPRPRELTPEEKAYYERQEAQKALQGPADITFTPDPQKDRIRALPPINPTDQEAVYRFVTIEGLGLPGKATGKLDAPTRQALEAIKNYFAKANPQNPRMTDQQAITAAKFKGR